MEEPICRLLGREGGECWVLSVMGWDYPSVDDAEDAYKFNLLYQSGVGGILEDQAEYAMRLGGKVVGKVEGFANMLTKYLPLFVVGMGIYVVMRK